MEGNFWAVLASAVLAMVVGAVWYGPLWGKLWLEVSGATEADMARREEMMRETNALYLIQFALTVVQLYVLSWFVASAWDAWDGMKAALLIWLGFVMPTIAGLAMWNAKPRKARLVLFALSAGYQLVCFLMFGIILSIWS